MKPAAHPVTRLSKIGCILLGLTLVMSACGEDGPEVVERGITTKTKGQAKAPVAGARCQDQLHDFLGSLDVLRGRLAMGLSYEGYFDAVRDARVSYRDLPVNQLEVDCLMTVGAPGERALNEYIDATNTWGDCLAVASCETESVEPELQHKWQLASDFLSAAHGGLQGLRGG